MNLRNLQAFVTVAESGSISRAAIRLHLTQPAISRRVQNFESAMGGTPLFDRSAKPLALTAAGKQVLRQCRDVQQALLALKAGAPQVGQPSGELRIGVGVGTDAFMGGPLDDVRRRFEHVELRVSTNWTARLIESLHAGEIDIAVAFVTDHLSIPPSIRPTSLGTEVVNVVAARNITLPRIANEALRLHDLANHRWILNPAGCAYRLAVQRAHDDAALPLRIAAEVVGRDLQLSMIARGAGLGLASRRTLESSAQRRALRVLQIGDFSLRPTIAVLRTSELPNFHPVADLIEKRVSRLLAKQKTEP